MPAGVITRYPAVFVDLGPRLKLEGFPGGGPHRAVAVLAPAAVGQVLKIHFAVIWIQRG